MLQSSLVVFISTEKAIKRRRNGPNVRMRDTKRSHFFFFFFSVLFNVRVHAQNVQSIVEKWRRRRNNLEISSVLCWVHSLLCRLIIFRLLLRCVHFSFSMKKVATFLWMNAWMKRNFKIVFCYVVAVIIVGRLWRGDWSLFCCCFFYLFFFILHHRSLAMCCALATTHFKRILLRK